MSRLSAVVVAVLASGSGFAAEPPKKPNVLFIAVDDLNHWVGHLGRNKQAKTPNIDRLAKMGVTFTRAYCAAPVCNPSRAALMSGLRPGTTGVYDNGQDWKPVIAEGADAHHAVPERRVQRLRQREDLPRQRPPRRRVDRLPRRRQGEGRRRTPTAKDDGVGGIKFQPADRRLEAARREHRRLRHQAARARSTTSRSSSRSGCTSRTCRGTCRRSTTTCSRSTRSSCRRRRRTT